MMPTWTASDAPLTLADALDGEAIKRGDYHALLRLLLRRLRPVPTEEELGALTLEELDRLVSEVLAPAIQRAIAASRAVKAMVHHAADADPEAS